MLTFSVKFNFNMTRNSITCENAVHLRSTCYCHLKLIVYCVTSLTHAIVKCRNNVPWTRHAYTKHVSRHNLADLGVTVDRICLTLWIIGVDMSRAK